VGISNYDDEQSREAISILRANGTPCLIHQAKYSMLVRWVEAGLLDTLEREGVGLIAFSPLAQGLLTDRYLKGVPADSRAAKNVFLHTGDITPEYLTQAEALNRIAAERGQTLAEMALAWLLKNPRVTSVLIGASSVAQLADNLKAMNNTDFTADEISRIETVLA
jgi:L-glyceraldehyde 3-phosphate reductase